MSGERHDCAGTVHDARMFQSYSCQTSAKYEEAGKWWCAHHAPSRVAAKRSEQDAKRDAERAAGDAAKVTAEALAAEYTARLGKPCRAVARFHLTRPIIIGYDIVVDRVPVEVPL